ncbi:MAG: hypothetical protein ACOC42_02100 [Halobacteriota archaeon]
MEAHWPALDVLISLSPVMRGLVAAIVGLATWLVGLLVLHWLWERYVRESEGGSDD